MTRALLLAPLELYLAAALGVVAVVGLAWVGLEVFRRRRSATGKNQGPVEAPPS